MNNATSAIHIDHLKKSFHGKEVVSDLSLHVNKGEIFGFLGPNGSGKTTTIRMICGLLTPDAGKGYCLGYDILTQSQAIKLESGYMPQHFSLYGDLTVYENLKFIAAIYGIKKRDLAIQNTLEALHLASRKDQLCNNLSGGWKQRVALACALLHDPKLLLLDEPTAGVDPKARRDFWHQIHRLSQNGVTILVSTHYMDEAERCHRLAYMMAGKLITVGTTKEIIAASNLTTWEITTENGHSINALQEQLEKLSTEWQVTPFGNRLHVTYPLTRQLEECLIPFQQNPWKWKKIAPTLEDIFVHLSNKS